VAKWIAEHAGQKVDDHTGWLYLERLGYTRQTPRPTHPEADEKAQEAFKKGRSRRPSFAFLESIPGPRAWRKPIFGLRSPGRRAPTGRAEGLTTGRVRCGDDPGGWLMFPVRRAGGWWWSRGAWG